MPQHHTGTQDDLNHRRAETSGKEMA